MVVAGTEVPSVVVGPGPGPMVPPAVVAGGVADGRCGAGPPHAAATTASPRAAVDTRVHRRGEVAARRHLRTRVPAGNAGGRPDRTEPTWLRRRDRVRGLAIRAKLEAGAAEDMDAGGGMHVTPPT